MTTTVGRADHGRAEHAAVDVQAADGPGKMGEGALQCPVVPDFGANVDRQGVVGVEGADLPRAIECAIDVDACLAISGSRVGNVGQSSFSRRATGGCKGWQSVGARILAPEANVVF